MIRIYKKLSNKKSNILKFKINYQNLLLIINKPKINIEQEIIKKENKEKNNKNL